jgi:colicin import membrane protein
MAEKTLKQLIAEEKRRQAKVKKLTSEIKAERTALTKLKPQITKKKLEEKKAEAAKKAAAKAKAAKLKAAKAAKAKKSVKKTAKKARRK